MSLVYGSVEVPLSGQEVPVIRVGDIQLTGVVEDWSHHHVVFSDPGTAEDAMHNGTLEHWLKIVNEPRYIMQQIKRRTPAQGPAANAVAMELNSAAAFAQTWAPFGAKKKQVIKKDWSMVLGSGSTKVGAGMYPAKYSFSPTSTANCGNASTPDFVVYNTGAAGTSTQATVVAYDNLYSSCTAQQVPSVYWAFNTGGTASTSVVLSSDGTQLAFMQTPSSGSAQLVLMTWKAKPTGRTVTSGSTNITSGSKNFTTTAGLTSMDVGAGISGTGIPTGDTIAMVTSATAGTLFTAASSNGTAGETLTITADAGGPNTLSTNSSYPTCTAPCMVTLTLKGTGTRADTISSPFYDYAHDALYVGDASGGLHKFTPVFNGTPAEVGSPWVALSSTALSSPVYDTTTGNVFVGDGTGYLYSVNSSSGTFVKSVQLAAAPGIVDGPLVDSTNKQLWVFASVDMNGSTSGTKACDSTTCNGVIQLPTTFAATTEFTEAVVGVGTTNTIYVGALDNLYWTSSDGTGNLYVNASNGTNDPKLMEIPITSTVMEQGGSKCQSGYANPPNCSNEVCATNIDNPLTTGVAGPSPVTEIYNGSTDRIFASVTASGSQTTCTGACIYSWNTTTALASGAASADGLAATGGTSGVIIDNTSSTVGASQVYYSTLGSGSCTTSGTVTSGGCAVQASQSALQ
jgi:hypothetical protein